MDVYKNMGDFILTEEQRKLAEENHNLIYKYMGNNDLDFSEWYDLLAIALCRAAYNYDYKSSQFSTFAFNSFKMAYLTEIRNQNTRLKRTNGSVLSLNTEYNDDDDCSGYCLQDIIADDLNLEESTCNKFYIDNIFSVLNKKEIYIISELSNNKTLAEIGRDLGLSKERIRQIKNEAINKISKNISIN